MDPAPAPRPPEVRKHLMTPGQPRPPQRYSTSVTSVQRWVMSSLTATTILHLAIGVVVAGFFSDRLDSQIGLLTLGGILGALGVVAALLIHQRSPLSPWLLAGVLPAVVGAIVLFG